MNTEFINVYMISVFTNDYKLIGVIHCNEYRNRANKWLKYHVDGTAGQDYKTIMSTAKQVRQRKVDLFAGVNNRFKLEYYQH